MGLSLALACMALVFFWAAGVRQRLLASRQAVVQAFAQLHQQLQRRHEVLAEMLEAALPALPLARDALDRVAAARLQVMAAAELVRSSPAQPGPIKSLDLAEASATLALEGLSGWVEQALSAPPALDVARPDLEASPAEMAEPLCTPLLATWQRLSVARQSVQFACLACNQALAAHQQAVQRMPASLVATLMGARALPLLTVIKHV
jgi:LemA protein